MTTKKIFGIAMLVLFVVVFVGVLIHVFGLEDTGWAFLVTAVILLWTGAAQYLLSDEDKK